MPYTYNTAAIRELLNSALSDEELMHFSYDYFHDVYATFSDGMSRSTKIHLLIEHCKRHECFDEILDHIKEDNPKQYYKFARQIDSERYYQAFGGYEILQLLEDVDPESFEQRHLGIYKDYAEGFRSIFRKRFEDREDVITKAKKELQRLNRPSSPDLPDLNALAYVRGKLHLLLASIYLEQQDLKEAAQHFRSSKEEFHNRQWGHLESLAYLGMDITYRKQGKYEEASQACEGARHSVDQVFERSKIKTEGLREAIKEEREKINEHLSPHEMSREQGETLITEKLLSLFKISTGDGLNTIGRTTDINLLSLKNYEQNLSGKPQKVTIDLTKRATAKNADYILEIDEEVKAVDGLKRGDWLLIDTEIYPKKLDNKTVAVLTREGDELYASLKTFIVAGDHYFLKSKSKGFSSIVLIPYKSELDPAKLKRYYTMYEGKIVGKLAHEVQISGAVILNRPIPKKSTKGITKAQVTQVPVVKSITAGLETPIALENVTAYYGLSNEESKDVDFGVKVAEDGMSGDGLIPGYIALFHQQENVKNRDIAAIIVTTSSESLELIRRFYFDDHPDREHWFLKSSNSNVKNLLIIPSGVNGDRVKQIHAKDIQSGRIQIYENAELAIAGKYVGLVPDE
ncbi:MAG: S24 family peptidase [Anaerolineae bacterium]